MTNNNLGMKWHKFTIYFALFFGALSSVIMAIPYFTGKVHAIANGTQIIYNGAEIYAQHPMMHTFDIMFGIFFILYAVLVIVTRFKLAGFKTNAPKLLYATIVVSALIEIAYALTYMVVLGFSFIQFISIIYAAAIALVFIVIYSVYYGRRKELFNK